MNPLSTPLVPQSTCLRLTTRHHPPPEKKKRSEEMRRSPPAAGEAATTLPAATPALEGSPRQDRGGLHQFWRRYPTNPNSIAHGICGIFAMPCVPSRILRGHPVET
uniref:Uncharacterized protein n=1 Tax=Oryza sativa subsp. japonica TaxID=39947 RepID=Q6Z3G3_ORYSJ|nr:hypothetical protein [Oryza sativa Japonica Group]BAD33002.1 hypothetical protein [Oryza sativa Japonica Group]